jgi:hypothetical protein
MDAKVERCPYCVLGDDFRLMVQRPGWLICENCGHIVIPDDPDFRCSCRNCPKVRRAA